MKCPVCDETLREIQKHGVNVDICPGCKGVWLDRGELEKIIDMASSDEPGREMRSNDISPQQRSNDQLRPSRDYDNHDYHEKRNYNERSHEQGYGQKKRKGSWLGDILGGFGDD